VLGLLGLGLAGLGWLGARSFPKPPRAPNFERLTYRQGKIWSARFSPDGQTLVYGAAWGEAPAWAIGRGPTWGGLGGRSGLLTGL